MNAAEILRKVLRKGWKTSEFWLTLSMVGLPMLDRTVGQAHTALGEHGTLGMIVGGAVVGAYTIGRSIVKAKTAGALLEPVSPPVDRTTIGR